MKYRKIILILIVSILALSLSGCIPNDGTYTVESPAGFWWGIWHGMIWDVTFFMGVFTNGKYTIYETINTGWGV